MSVVVWDGISLAADRGGTDGFTMWAMDKIHMYGSEALTGVGPHDAIAALVGWYKAGASPDNMPRSLYPAELIVTSPDGLRRYEANRPTPIDHGLNKCAFGVGRDFAYGAMAMGATATQAVEVACQYSGHCGHGAQTVRMR